MNLFDETSRGLAALAETPLWAMLLLKATSLLALAWLIHFALARANPQWRVLLWRGTAVGLALLPLVGVLLPGIELSIERPEPVIAAAPFAVAPAVSVDPLEALPYRRPQPGAEPATEAPSAQSASATWEADSPASVWSLSALGTSMLPAIWLGGFALLVVRLGVGYARVRRVVRSSQPAPDWTIDECRRVAGALGYGRQLPVLRSSTVSTPVLCGIWRPALLLPERMCRAAYRDELRGVLAHELAHARFADCPWNVGVQLVSMALWFHPLCWRMRRAHQSACDAACDAVAAGWLGNAAAYCRMLARVAVDASPPPAVGFAMAGLSNVSFRLKALRRRVFDKPLQRRSVAAFALSSMLAVALVGGLRVVYAEPVSKTKTADENGAKTAERKASAKTADGEMPVRVVDPSGKPVLGAKLEVTLYWAGAEEPVKSEHTCGPDGFVTISLPKEAPTRLTISASAERSVPVRASWLNFRDRRDPIPAEFTFTLEQGVPIGGVVHDERGAPIEGAEVRITASSPHSAAGPVGAVMGRSIVETDAAGKWRCHVLRKNLKQLVIALQHEGYLKRTIYNHDGSIAKLLEALEQQKAVLVMKKGITIEGTITDPQGAPISGANVLVGWAYGAPSAGSYAYSGSGGLPSPDAVRTDRQGHYRLTGRRPGPYHVCVGAPGMAVDGRLVEAAPGMESVDFQLQKGRLLWIQVVDRNGKPVAGASVEPTRWRNGLPLNGLASSEKTNAKGLWSWNGAPADKMTFLFGKPGYMEILHSALEAREEPYVITLPPPLVISGRVVDAETKNPIKEFRLFQTGRHGPGSRGYSGELTTTGQSDPGTYRVELSRARLNRVIRVEAPGYHPAESRKLESEAGNITIDFELQKARTVAGTVRLPNGDPAAGARVVVCAESVNMVFLNGRNYVSPRLSKSTTDAAGRFFAQSKDEKYTLVVLDERGFAEVTVEELAASNEITIQPWARLEGTVEIGGRTEAGQRLSLHFYPSVRPAARSAYFSYDTRSDADGKFTFEQVIPGVAYLTCTAENGTSLGGVEVELASGETAKAQIGGPGLPVVGRLELPAKADKRSLSKWADAMLFRKPLSHGVPRDLRQQDADVREQLYQQWRVGRNAEQLGGPRYGCKLGEGGSIRFDAVPPAVYQLRVKIPVKHDGAATTVRFAEGVAEVTVRDLPGRPSDQPFDLGVLKLEFKDVPGSISFSSRSASD